MSKSDPGEHSRSGWKRAARIAWFVAAGLALAIFVVSIPGYLRGLEQQAFTATAAIEPAIVNTVLNFTGMIASLLAAVVSLSLAALLFWRKPEDWMALYLSFFLLGYGVVMAGPLEAIARVSPVFSQLAIQYGQTILVATPVVVLFCIFPNGKFQPDWSKWLAVVSVVLLPSLILSPLISEPEKSGILDWLVALLWILVLFGALYSQILRYRHIATMQARQQTRWAVFGFVLWVIAMFVLTIPYFWLLSLPAGSVVPAWAGTTAVLWWLSLLIIPVTLTIAVMRYRLWDLELVVNRALVYGGLTAIVVAIYVLVVGTLGTLFQAQGNFFVALLATGLVAVLFQPLRQRVQRGVNRLIYGERDDPVTVLTRLGRQLELAIPQESVLPVLAETVALTLKLPYVGINLRTNGEVEVVAEYGRSSVANTELPLVYQGEHIGELLVGQRGPGDPFNPGEMALLGNIARQAGAAAHSVQLTADLQRSRQRLVTAREEERRRLRRDLHDGLGPALAAHLLKIGSARVLFNQEPDEAEQLLDELEGDIESTVVEIRHLVYGLRPPELDQLGLVGAIEQYVSQYSMKAHPAEGDPGRSGVNITVYVPEILPSLPAAVEVAAYRIVQEGLNNVLRHAQARRCTITLSMNREVLELNLCDDGQGLAAGHPPGIGLSSMRERAEELGGSCRVTGLSGGGTQVLARLPLIDLEQVGQEH